MSTPATPGGVEPRSVPCEPYLRRLAWSLYDFGVGEADPKPEHRRWLDENLVPLLPIIGARVRLRGVASRSGPTGFNQMLSEKRAAAVRDYLLARGARPDQITTTAAGEADADDAGEDNGTEDPHFRAVVVEISFPVPTGPSRFDR